MFAGLFFEGISYANTGSIYGFGTIAPALGNAYVAHPEDPSAAYYNPAGLALQRKEELLLGVSYYYPALWIKGIDGTKNYIDNDRTLGITLGIDNNWGEMTGYKQLSNISTGIFLATPPDRAYSADTIPTSTISFPLYKDTASQLMLVLGLGYRVTDFLQLGVSVLLYMPGKMTTDYYVQPAPGTQTISPVALVYRSLIISATPEFGFILKPVKWLEWGTAYRQKNASGLFGTTSFMMAGMPPISETNDEKVFATPDQIETGFSVKARGDLRINADLTYSIWSDKALTDTEGNTFTASDTFSPSLGIEYKPVPTWAVRAGYMYSPSPFPPQTGDTNYADSDKNIYSVGGGYYFRWFKTAVTSEVSLFVQWQQLMERNNDKQPSYLGYSNGGNVWSSGISIAFRL